jgi:hypothetical protein
MTDTLLSFFNAARERGERSSPATATQYHEGAWSMQRKGLRKICLPIAKGLLFLDLRGWSPPQPLYRELMTPIALSRW